MATDRRKRIPIEERREQILEAALEEFGHKGLHGGTTVTIAKQVGISHPNRFRIYPTKHELVIATLERVFDMVEREMLTAGERSPDTPLQAMSDAWGGLMERRERSEEHTSELQSRGHLVCRLLLEKKKTTDKMTLD